MAMRDILLILAAFILVALTVYFLYRGCSCLRGNKSEGFENKAKADKDDLSEDELALFEDLKADKYSAKDIDKMVADGVIDQGLVEKFLNKLDSFEAIEAEAKDAEAKDAKKEKPKPKPVAKA